MFRFFRQIRYQLMGMKKMTTYLAYAVGEILLVVIGILIALQVNNWNEKIKDEEFEKKILSELLTNIEQDIQETDTAFYYIDQAQKSTMIVIDHLKTRKPYHDSLGVHFANAFKFWSFSFNKTNFEMAKTEGLHLIKNDSIRIKIARVNDYYLEYVKVLESRFQDYKTNIVLDYSLPLFDYYNFDEMKPINYKLLQDDSTYIGILKTISAMRTHYILWHEERYSVLKEIRNTMKLELDD